MSWSFSVPSVPSVPSVVNLKEWKQIMPQWLQNLMHILTAILSALAARNGQVVGFGDWQTLLPAVGAGASFSIGPIVSLVNNVFRSPNGLKLVAQLLPYREKVLPQEVRDALFNALRWRFAAKPEAVALVDQLIQLDVQMEEPEPKR